MDEISVGDIESLFCKTLVLYKGAPVFFKSITMGREAILLVLEHGKDIRVKFSLDDFSAPRGRIGFVNHGNLAFYFFRKPQRQYAVGVNSRNISIHTLRYFNAERQMAMHKEVSQFDKKSLHMAMLNQYPKFSEAFAQAIKSGGAIAFDKQFAIGSDGVVWYKSRAVGQHSLDKQASLKNIVFQKEYEFLQLPLLQNHGKTSKTFGPA